MSTKKLKWGLDAIYTPLYWLGFNARWDYVQPDLDAALAEAVKVARELVNEVDDLGRDAVIEIADESGETILTVAFSDVVGPH